jgi:hypothetical protein
MDAKKAFEDLSPSKRKLFDTYVSAMNMEIVEFGLLEPDDSFRLVTEKMMKELGAEGDIPTWSETIPIARVRCFGSSIYPVPFREIEEVVSYTLLTCRNIEINEILREALAEYQTSQN